jgi:hypothetical protein
MEMQLIRKLFAGYRLTKKRSFHIERDEPTRRTYGTLLHVKSFCYRQNVPTEHGKTQVSKRIFFLFTSPASFFALLHTAMRMWISAKDSRLLIGYVCLEFVYKIIWIMLKKLVN